MEDLAAAVSTDVQLRILAAGHAHAAAHDALTGMPNRRRLMQDLKARLAPGAPGTVLAILDLDGFKAYNDTHGHLAGDDLLCRVGARLTGEAERAGGDAYRMGGDEFCLLLPAGHDPGRIAAQVRERHDAGVVTASHGHVTLRAGLTVPEALRLADERLYASKLRRAGGGTRQAATVLKQALAEQSPATAAHTQRLIDLAVRLAQEHEQKTVAPTAAGAFSPAVA